MSKQKVFKCFFIFFGIVCSLFFLLLVLSVIYIDYPVIFGLFFLCFGGILQFTFLSREAKVDSKGAKGFKKIKKRLTSLGEWVGFALLFLLILSMLQFNFQTLALFWFPNTLYQGLPGLYRWWMADRGIKLDSFLRKWFKIEGLFTFLYSLGLLLYGLFFWEFSILLLLSSVIFISSGISIIILGALRELGDD